MVVRQRAIEIMQSSLSSLRRSGLIDQEISVRDNPVLFGTGSELDSIGFVTFVADLEDRLVQETNMDISLVLDEMYEFNPDNQSLSANSLAQYIEKLTAND
ncbi:MAG: hypothetical protein L0177_00795 [Chloroflexi bacterium]|nr:hypothetical protein [Chloroflexota bacterium]